MHHGLSDEQWKVVEDLFPKPAWTGRPKQCLILAKCWMRFSGSITRVPNGATFLENLVLDKPYLNILTDGIMMVLCKPSCLD
jgi:hypothetical protein